MSAQSLSWVGTGSQVTSSSTCTRTGGRWQPLGWHRSRWTSTADGPVARTRGWGSYSTTGNLDACSARWYRQLLFLGPQRRATAGGLNRCGRTMRASRPWRRPHDNGVAFAGGLAVSLHALPREWKSSRTERSCTWPPSGRTHRYGSTVRTTPRLRTSRSISRMSSTGPRRAYHPTGGWSWSLRPAINPCHDLDRSSACRTAS